jgi:hypothetical protein
MHGGFTRQRRGLREKGSRQVTIIRLHRKILQFMFDYATDLSSGTASRPSNMQDSRGGRSENNWKPHYKCDKSTDKPAPEENRSSRFPNQSKL